MSGSAWLSEQAEDDGRDSHRSDFLLGLPSTEETILTREGKARPLAVAFCASLPLLWDGVPFAMVGLPRAGGEYATTLLVLLGLVLFTVKKANRYQKFNIFTTCSGSIFILFSIVSILSGMFFFTNPFVQWAPTLVYYTPSLLVFLAISLDLRVSEMLIGVAVASTISAMLVIFDRYVYHFDFINQFATVSGFQDDTRRVMMLKNDVGLAICLTFAWLTSSRSIFVMLVCGAMWLLTSFDMVVVIETRLVIGAALLAMALYTLFVGPVERRVIVLLLAVCVGAFLGPIIFAKYIDRMSHLSNLAEDSSVHWRLLTVEHYKVYFEKTIGLGFGLMSLKDGSGSMLAYSIYEAPLKYGIPYGQWGFFLADISFYGALFQFGYLGLLLVVGMTALTAFHLIRYGLNRDLPFREGVSIAGFFVLFLLVSPWPTNLFTLPWSMMSGNMLFSAAARACYILRVAQKAGRAQRGIDLLPFRRSRGADDVAKDGGRPRRATRDLPSG